MSKPIHIEGWSKDINIPNALSHNYDLPASFDYDNESLETIPDCYIRIWTSDKRITLKKAQEKRIREELGDLTLVGQAIGYSEYTIMGFNVTSAFIGGHNIQQFVDDQYGKYLHVLIGQRGDV